MALYYKRNTDIYISKASDSSAGISNTVKLNVKDFSFNQASNIVNVGRDTLDPLQERIVAPYVSIVAPVTFSFTTYILPLVDTNVTSPEEYLWTSLMGDDTIPGKSNSTTSTIDFADGNVSSLHELTLWFDNPNQSEGNYRINNAIVDEATISFDINSIAEIQWRGRALSIIEDNIPPNATDRTGLTNYLKNRLSTITTSVNGTSYTLALTGGEIRINNNNTFYGRNQLGETTVPTGHYTGNRLVTGNLDFYIKSGVNQSVDLLNVLRTNASNSTYESTYLADIDIKIGGNIAPYVQVSVPQALFDIPQQNFDEVISMSIPFTAKEESGNYCSIIYNMP